MTPYGDIDLGQNWPGWWLAPNHYLSQCWILIIKVLLHSHESNFTASTQATLRYNEFKKFIFKITVAPPKGPWIKPIMSLIHICRTSQRVCTRFVFCRVMLWFGTNLFYSNTPWCSWTKYEVSLCVFGQHSALPIYRSLLCPNNSRETHIARHITATS